MIALIDCNNFYASCERLFRPDLKDQPIIVLSSNDGCVIARSNEAKALGINMGEPFFKIKALCARHQVQVFSSNFCLYGDLSQRVMMTIEQAWPALEIYSIDEAFLDLSSLPEAQIEPFCEHLQKKILKDTGIPTSIGLGLTKTLAKAANYLCKKVFKIPVFYLQEQSLLQQIPIGEVWGIGRQWSKKLSSQGIDTAFDLAQQDVHLLKRQYNVVLMRTALELQGIACGGLDNFKAKQSILSSRSFGQMQSEFDGLAQAISHHCARAVEKMRAQQLVAQSIYVFVHTNRYRDDLAQHCPSIQLHFIHPTDDLRLITQYAKRCLMRIYKSGYYYKKAGICLEGLIAKDQRQLHLFSHCSEDSLERSEAWMSVLEEINKKFGRSTLRLAAEGYVKPWAARTGLKSPAYTTRWSEVPRV
jgi:DNA polymerase V